MPKASSQTHWQSWVTEGGAPQGKQTQDLEEPDRQTDRQQSLSLQGRKPARGMPTAASTRRHGLHGLCGQGCELRAVALLLQRGGRALVGWASRKNSSTKRPVPWLAGEDQSGRKRCMHDRNRLPRSSTWLRTGIWNEQVHRRISEGRLFPLDLRQGFWTHPVILWVRAQTAAYLWAGW